MLIFPEGVQRLLGAGAVGSVRARRGEITGRGGADEGVL